MKQVKHKIVKHDDYGFAILVILIFAIMGAGFGWGVYYFTDKLGLHFFAPILAAATFLYPFYMMHKAGLLDPIKYETVEHEIVGDKK